jgi:diacylglycerol kinase family enzyme
MIGAERISGRLLQRAHQFDVVIVLGGDGTARAVAAKAPRDGPPLILLPGGTMNLLPRVLYGSLAWPEALIAALERGVARRLGVGRANNEFFFIAALFGEPTLLARAREAAREGRIFVAWRRLRQALRRAFTRELRVDAGGGMRKAAAVGVLCPAFAGRMEGGPEWALLKASHFGDLARVGLLALSEAWRADAAVELREAGAGMIFSTGLIPATLDGEPRTFLSRVRIRYEPNGPRVLALEPQAD